jgi:hypothetical protein
MALGHISHVSVAMRKSPCRNRCWEEFWRRDFAASRSLFLYLAPVTLRDAVPDGSQQAVESGYQRGGAERCALDKGRFPACLKRLLEALSESGMRASVQPRR